MVIISDWLVGIAAAGSSDRTSTAANRISPPCWNDVGSVVSGDELLSLEHAAPTSRQPSTTKAVSRPRIRPAPARTVDTYWLSSRAKATELSVNTSATTTVMR